MYVIPVQSHGHPANNMTYSAIGPAIPTTYQQLTPATPPTHGDTLYITSTAEWYTAIQLNNCIQWVLAQ
jgi:hypothetical protein